MGEIHTCAYTKATLAHQTNNNRQQHAQHTACEVHRAMSAQAVKARTQQYSQFPAPYRSAPYRSNNPNSTV
jgi:hypothetical protein